MNTTAPEKQLEVEAIADLLRATAIGGTCTYESMVLGCRGAFDRWWLHKARRLVEEETGLRFATIYKIGVRKISAIDIPGIGSASRARIGRIARVQSKRMSKLSYNDIDPATQKRIDLERSLLGAVAVAASEKQRRKMEAGESTPPTLPE